MKCIRLRLLPLIMLPLVSSADVFVRSDIIKEPSPHAFSVCFNHTCKDLSTVSLSDSQWREIRSLFLPAARDSTEERRLIADAIAYLETLVGAAVNSENDKGRNFAGMFSEGNQMDCIDESTNTTTYLTMLYSAGLLRWHEVKDRSTRGFFIFGMPHTTAVLLDNSTGERWAVDSWFHDNGVAPEILPLSTWRWGWSPET